MHVKICGITSLEDALAAADAGADLLGFNFYTASPRYIKPERCADIMSALRARGLGAASVGVFVNTPAAEVAVVADRLALDFVQLHGDEPPAALASLRILGMHVFKALRPAGTEEAGTLALRYGPARGAPAWLIDAHRPGAYGGTGACGDWSLAAKFARRVPIILAGGLNPGNVAEAIDQVAPWGVDVASGVEASPGVKDHRRVAAFVAAARRAGNGVPA